MRISDLTQLDHVDTRALVVNLHTELATARALASLQAHATSIPVLVVDLDSTAWSRTLLSTLSGELGIDVLETTGAAHGALLDRLVTELRADFALLCDSDAALLDPTTVSELRSRVDDPDVFGSGFADLDVWFDGDAGGGPGPSVYSARFWPVLALLRVEAIRVARDAGVSFVARWSSGDPATFYDTGADIDRWLRSAGWRYSTIAALPLGAVDRVDHVDGLTWKTIQGRYEADELEAIHASMIDELRRYGIDWSSFAIPPTSLAPA